MSGTKDVRELTVEGCRQWHRDTFKHVYVPCGTEEEEEEEEGTRIRLPIGWTRRTREDGTFFFEHELGEERESPPPSIPDPPLYVLQQQPSSPGPPSEGSSVRHPISVSGSRPSKSAASLLKTSGFDVPKGSPSDSDESVPSQAECICEPGISDDTEEMSQDILEHWLKIPFKEPREPSTPQSSAGDDFERAISEGCINNTVMGVTADGQHIAELDLSLSADNLKRADPITASDVVAYLRTRHSESAPWQTVSRTNIAWNESNPKWPQRLTVPLYSPHDDQQLRIEVYDVDNRMVRGARAHEIGQRYAWTSITDEAEPPVCTVKKIMDEGVVKWTVNRRSFWNPRSESTVVLRLWPRPVGKDYHAARLHVSAHNLKWAWLHRIGSLHPYFVVEQKIGQGDSVVLYQSDISKKFQDPTWRKAIFKIHTVNTPADTKLVLRVMGRKRFSHDVMLDEKSATLAELLGPEQDLPLSEQRGQLHVSSFNHWPVPCHTAFLKNGVDIRYQVGVDVVSSNEYVRRACWLVESAIRICSSKLTVVEAFGFGIDANRKGDSPEVGYLPLNPAAWELNHGRILVEHLTQSYDLCKNEIDHVENYGCHLSELISHARRSCVGSTSVPGAPNPAGPARPKQCFNVLILVVSAQCHDMKSSLRNIVNAASSEDGESPLFIVLLGVGLSPKAVDQMKRLEGRLQPYPVRRRGRNVIGFVPNRNIVRYIEYSKRMTPEEFAQLAFAGAAVRLREYASLHGIPFNSAPTQERYIM